MQSSFFDEFHDEQRHVIMLFGPGGEFISHAEDCFDNFRCRSSGALLGCFEHPILARLLIIGSHGLADSVRVGNQ